VVVVIVEVVALSCVSVLLCSTRTGAVPSVADSVVHREARVVQISAGRVAYNIRRWLPGSECGGGTQVIVVVVLVRDVVERKIIEGILATDGWLLLRLCV